LLAFEFACAQHARAADRFAHEIIGILAGIPSARGG
jgi:hypothetical protein